MMKFGYKTEFKRDRKRNTYLGEKYDKQEIARIDEKWTKEVQE